MVIFVGKERDDQSYNHGGAVGVSHWVNSLREGVKLTVMPLPMGK